MDLQYKKKKYVYYRISDTSKGAINIFSFGA